MLKRHAMLVACVLACGGHSAAPAPVSRTNIVLPGPAVTADSLRVAVTDSFGLTRIPGVHGDVVSTRRALDLIDSGANVVVTDRPAVIRYASARSDFAVIPFAWDRQYALVSPTAPAVDVLNAVQADARRPTLTCPTDSAERSTLARVAYMASDSIARSLAERLVGLNKALRATPVDRLSGSESTYIVARPVDSTTCEIGGLHVTPLVETRSRLIVRRGAVGVEADSAGHLRLETKP